MRTCSMSAAAIVVVLWQAALQAACAQQGVMRDPAVAQAPLADLESRPAAETWLLLDSLAYWAIPLAPPDGFYDSVQGLEGTALRAGLHDLIDDHTVFPYTHGSLPRQASHRVDVWDIIALADRHPDDDDSVLCIYTNRTMDVVFTGVDAVAPGRAYDREHSWPKSHGFSKRLIGSELKDAQVMANPAWSDCHHLFACESNTNTERNNTLFGPRGAAEVTEFETAANLGRGGPATGDDERASYRTGNADHEGHWQVWSGRRGDIARAMFYMDVRYEADVEGEADLRLTDDPAEIDQTADTKRAWELGGVAELGLLATLLAWHAEDPVDDLERRRNTMVFLFQGNRNPFVDHPEFVGQVFGEAEEVVIVEGPDNPEDFVPAAAITPWINEIHYDNSGSDTGEFIEIAGPAGLSLEGWRLVLYNGADGAPYTDAELEADASIPDQQAGMGAVAFELGAIQNGDADGVALVDPDGLVVD
ncbi:MAG: endonuclease, partial [Phycisphaerales bacterium JB039]